MTKLRTGRKVGRTIYVQVGPEPSDLDMLIGLMDTPEWAALIVASVNQYAETEPIITSPEPIP